MTGVTAALTTTASSVTGLLTDILPIALGIFALVFGVKKAISFFKQTT